VRRLIVCLTAAAALAAPTAALAGSPSAGDQQYTDPLAPKHHSQTQTSTTPAPQAPAPTPVTVPSSAAPASSASPTTTSTTTTAAHDPGGKSLPRTGYDVLLGVLVGGSLLALGAYLHRLARVT
jgi:hypothetical protein